MKRYIFNERNKQYLWNYLKSITCDGKYVVEIKLSVSKRSDAQNRLSHLWYAERSADTGMSPAEEKAYCKLTHGAPILAAENSEFAIVYGAISSLPYEQQLIAIRQVPVTSIMTVKQKTAYLQEVDRESAEAGILLSRPDDFYWEAMGYRRKPNANSNTG